VTSKQIDPKKVKRILPLPPTTIKIKVNNAGERARTIEGPKGTFFIFIKS